MADLIRSFVAVDADDRLRRQIALVQRTLRPAAPDAKWVEPALCHVTLQFLGYVPEDALPDIAAACRSAAATVTPFGLSFEGIGAFPSLTRARVLWMGMTAGQSRLAALQAALGARLAPLGFEPEQRPFSPHLTLARFKQAPPRGFEAVVQPFRQRRFGRLEITELRLMRSVLHRDGPVYTVLEAFPLG